MGAVVGNRDSEHTVDAESLGVFVLFEDFQIYRLEVNQLRFGNGNGYCHRLGIGFSVIGSVSEAVFAEIIFGWGVGEGAVFI